MLAASGRLALLAAAAAALQGVAEALTLTDGSPGPQATTREEVQKWLDQAAKANADLDAETKTVMDDIASWMRAGDKTKKEQELEMLESVLAQWDAENETSVDETARRMAALAFRRQLRALFSRPGKKAARRSATEEAGSVDEGVRAWMDQVMKATDALEKDSDAVESDLAEPVPKSAEEKDLEKLQSLLDAVDPKNASEMAEAGQSLVTEEFRRFARSRASRPWSSSSESHEEVWRHRRHFRKAYHASKKQRANVKEQVKEWVPGAEKEQSDLDKKYDSIHHDLSEQVDHEVFEKSKEEKDIAEARRKLDAEKKRVEEEMREALANVTKEQKKFEERMAEKEKEQDEQEKELFNQIQNMTEEQEETTIPLADKELAVLQGIWDKYELDNENTSAEDVTEKLYPENGTSSNDTMQAWGADELEEETPPAPPQVAELRQEVERLKAEVSNLTEQVAEADAEPPTLQQRRLAVRRKAVQVLTAALDGELEKQ